MGWLDWLLIPPCPVCERSSQGGEGCFCRDCVRQLQALQTPSWMATVDLPGSSGSPPPLLLRSQTGMASTPVDPYSLRLFSWGNYEGALRRALQQLKYNRQPDIGTTLGRWMGQRLNAEPNPWPGFKPWIVPIPLHPDKLKTRGYNQAELISQGLCEEARLHHRPQTLQRIRATQPQFGLSSQERQSNLAQAFQVSQTPDQPIVLVDDIFTTGSTLSAACEALLIQGIPVLAALVVARPARIQS